MSENSNQEEVVYTPEQLAEFREKQIGFFNAQLPMLRLQTEFEELKARINKAHFEGLTARVEYMQLELNLQESAKSEPKEEE